MVCVYECKKERYWFPTDTPIIRSEKKSFSYFRVIGGSRPELLFSTRKALFLLTPFRGWPSTISRLSKLIGKARSLRSRGQLDRADQLVFAPHPAARLVASQCPAVTIWQANQPGSAPGAGREILDLPEAALVTRPDLSVMVTPVDHATMVFAAALIAQATLERAYTAAQSESAAFDIVSALAALLSSGSSSHIVGDNV